MSDRAPFVRKVAGALDNLTRSWPVTFTSSLRYGTGEVARVSRGTLADRTDEHGNIEPYAADDPDVLRELFGIGID
jgi:hypothetical protein